MLLFSQSHEAQGTLSLLFIEVVISLFRISFIENFFLCIHKFTLVGKTWICQSCQLILLFFLLSISLNTLPLSSSHFTSSLTSIWLITFSHCPFCMSPITNLLLYLFFPFFLSVLLLVAVTISGTCFSLSQTPHAVLLLKGFLSHLLDTQPMVRFSFILKDTPLLRPFFLFLFYFNIWGIQYHSFIHP